MRPKRRLAAAGFVVLCAAALLLVFSHRVLWSLGAILDSSEPPQKAITKIRAMNRIKPPSQSQYIPRSERSKPDSPLAPYGPPLPL